MTLFNDDADLTQMAKNLGTKFGFCLLCQVTSEAHPPLRTLITAPDYARGQLQSNHPDFLIVTRV